MTACSGLHPELPLYFRAAQQLQLSRWRLSTFYDITLACIAYAG
jgi:hypothetical protein